MSKIICPECGKVISSYANSCPDCGFPVEKYLKEHNIINLQKCLVCPKCGMIYGGLENNEDPIYLKCKFCGSFVVQTEKNWEEFSKICRINKNYYIEFPKEYGNNQFSDEAYQHRLDVIKKENADINKRLEQRTYSQPSTPHCPTCNSTNIRKIGTGERAVSIIGLGLFSRKINKTWKCNDCGHTW